MVTQEGKILKDDDVSLDISHEQLNDVAKTLQFRSVAERHLGSDLPACFDYDTTRVPLYRIIQDALIYKGLIDSPVELEKLHECIDPELSKVDEFLINDITRQFYEDIPGLENALKILREQFLYPLFPGEEFLWQRTPTIRFHFPNTEGVNANSNKLLHIDSMIGHPVQEINVWLSLTDCQNHDSFRVVSLAESLKELSGCGYNVVELYNALQYGTVVPRAKPVESTGRQFIVMDSRCIHGPALNVSNTTRISIDFRIISNFDLDRLPFVYQGCGRRRSLFKIGDYYEG